LLGFCDHRANASHDSKTIGAIVANTNLSNFDSMPDSALVDLHLLRALTGKSRATIYRWIVRGIIPRPRRLGRTRNHWTAGEVRAALGAAA
jgi:predicted DNA-binding transcriptional regulator AlpA